MKIYEAFNWIKEADYTPHGYLIFNNSPEGQLKGEALKTIFEAAKKGELVPVELFNQVKKERDNLEKLKQEPFMNKPCISSKVCEHDKEVVIDKIRAEIEEAKTNDGIYIDKAYVLEIIDKYKAEYEIARDEVYGRDF